MRDFEVGDRVRIVKSVQPHCQELVIGSIKTITDVDKEDLHHTYELGNSGIWASKEEIELVATKKPTIEELKNMPIGTRVTTDKESDNVFVKTEEDELEFYNKDRDNLDGYDIEDDLSINESDYGKKIIKIEKPTEYEVVYEYSAVVQEMTIAEIEKELGHPVKIIKEDE